MEAGRETTARGVYYLAALGRAMRSTRCKGRERMERVMRKVGGATASGRKRALHKARLLYRV